MPSIWKIMFGGYADIFNAATGQFDKIAERHKKEPPINPKPKAKPKK